MTNIKAAILKTGITAWIFEQHAQRLARLMNVEISDHVCQYNYLLGLKSSEPLTLPLDCLMSTLFNYKLTKIVKSEIQAIVKR